METQDTSDLTALDHINDINSHTNFHSKITENSQVKKLLTSYSNNMRGVSYSKPVPQEIEMVDMKHVSNNSNHGNRDRLKRPQLLYDLNASDKLYDEQDDGNGNWAANPNQQQEDVRSLPITNSQRPDSKQEKGTNLQNSTIDYAFTKEGDDADLSLESLSQLLETVRHIAQEIAELYAPMRKEEEERMRKHLTRKKKEITKNVLSQLDPPRQQFHTHSLQERMQENIGDKKNNISSYGGLVPSKNTESFVASLHVENEQLSRTWPRSRCRSTSREGHKSIITVHQEKFNNIEQAKTFSSFIKPQIAADWNTEERDILNKSFQRNPKTGVNAQSGIYSKSVKKQPDFRKTGGPSISVIPPLLEYNNEPWDMHNGILPWTSSDAGKSYSVTVPRHPSMSDGDSCDIIIPSSHAISCDTNEHGDVLSNNAGAGTNSSVKVRLRKRKSVDQGLGQDNVALERY